MTNSSRSCASGNVQRLLAIFTLMLMALTTAGCGADQNSQDTNVGSVLKRGLGGDPEGLDPQKFMSTQAGNVLRDLGEGLLRYKPSGDLEPGIAVSWEVSDDGLEYRFNIRPGVKWSDGSELTAFDFVYSYQRLFNPDNASASADKLNPIKNARAAMSGEVPPEQVGVEAPDAQTLVIRLQSPTPYFLQLLAHPAAFPVHRRSIEEHGDQFAREGNLVTNGAYVLDAWDLSSRLVLTRNPHYWDDANTAFDSVQYFVGLDSNEVNRFRAGELDITAGINSAHFQQMKQERPNEVKVTSHLATYYYGLNLTRPPFKDNPKLRRALSMALDREAIVKAVTQRGEQAAYSLVPPGVSNYQPALFDYSMMTKDEREAEARRLYEQAGYGPDNPAQFELRYNTAESHKGIAIAAQSMWHTVLGADVTLHNEEFKVFLSNVRDMRQTNVFRLSWTGDYNDAYTFLQLFGTANENNMTAYSNAHVDELLGKAARESDLQKRRSYLQEAEALALSEHPLIPIYYFVNKHLVRESIDGWEPNILDFHLSRHLRPRAQATSDKET